MNHPGKKAGSIKDRFWIKVNKTDSCWEWTGAVNRQNYGVFLIGSQIDQTRKVIKAHRYSYVLHNGPIPDGLSVCHKCDNPKCINPDHLFLGTHNDNMKDMVAKNRQWRATGEKHGSHKLKVKQIEEIKRRYQHTEVTLQLLANEYKVSTTHVWRIIKGLRWSQTVRH